MSEALQSEGDQYRSIPPRSESEEPSHVVAGDGTVPPPPAAAPSSGRKFLIAVDESEESLYALTWSLDHLIFPSSFASHDQIVLLHVQNHPQVFIGPAGPGFYITPEILESVRKSQDEVSKRVLLRAKTLCDEKQLASETMVAIGDPRDAICDAVDQLNPTFLIVGSHGYGAIKRTFLGSVSDYCAHKAKCPVVIVKKQHK